MIEYSNNNTTYFYYGTKIFGPKLAGEEFKYHLGRCSRPNKTFKQECYITAELLAKKAKNLGRIPTVLLSGGLDSHVVCKSFIETGIPFNTATFRFLNGKNKQEIQYVDYFCNQHSIAANYVDIDVVKFINSQYAKKLFINTYCHYAILLFHMYLFSYVWSTGGMPIHGGGDILIASNEEAEWFLYKKESMLPNFFHLKNEKIDGCVAFFQYTPEITLSFFKEPEILEAANSKVILEGRHKKYDMYHRLWSGMPIREKYTGHELVHDLLTNKANYFRTYQATTYNDTWSIPLKSAISMLEPA